MASEVTIQTLFTNGDAPLDRRSSSSLTYDALRRLAAQQGLVIGQQDTSQATLQELLRHYYFSLVLWESQRDADRYSGRLGYLAELEFRFNDVTTRESEQRLVADDLPAPDLFSEMIATSPSLDLVVFPSLSRLINRSPRPPQPEQKPRPSSYFEVELYAPHEHESLLLEYLAEGKRENSALTHPFQLLSPAADSIDRDFTVAFLAIREGRVVGYCACRLLLAPPMQRQGEEDEEAMRECFGQWTDTPRHLLEIAGISVLRAHAGHHISLVLLYHALYFAWSHRDVLPVSHIVAQSAAIATRDYLTRRFDFVRRGTHRAFTNEDYVDALDDDALDHSRRLLELCARRLIVLIRTWPADRRPPNALFVLPVIVHQLALWFGLSRSAEILRLLITLSANLSQPVGTPSEETMLRFASLTLYIRRNIGERFRFLSEPDERAKAWLRAPLFYHKDFGMRSVQQQHDDDDDKTRGLFHAAEFGLEAVVEVVATTLALDDGRGASALTEEIERSLDALRDDIDRDVALTDNYTVTEQQLRALIRLWPERTAPYEAKCLFIERQRDAQRRVSGEIYHSPGSRLDTFLPASLLERALRSVGEQYARGETKNFARPGEATEQEEQTLRYPDNVTALRQLVQEAGAIARRAEAEGDDTRVLYRGLKLDALWEYIHCLFLKLQYNANDMSPFVRE